MAQQPIYGDQLLEGVTLRNEVVHEFNPYTIEQKLKQQQKESEEDSKWLCESETTLVSLLNIILTFISCNPIFTHSSSTNRKTA